MENKQFSDYKIADISSKVNNEISELEKTINGNTNKDIVLIAYQPNEIAKN